jgi:alpha-ketoglutarate-dependent 2,4-dichlorophenoxyacetate dioxygenase
MDAVPFGPGFAAELRGIDLIDVVSCDAAYCAVREAFEEHTFLVLRDQNVSDDVQIGFSRAFGPLERTKVGLLSAGSLYIRMTNVGRGGRPVLANHREALINKANQLWHTDSSFKTTPALASVLSARIIPAEGGETEFTSTRPGTNRQARSGSSAPAVTATLQISHRAPRFLPTMLMI